MIKNRIRVLNTIIFNFSQKSNPDSEFFDFVMNNLHKNTESSESQSSKRTKFEAKSGKGSSSFTKEKNYFKLKDKILSPKVKQDMIILKLQEGFTTNELRQKFLSLAKLYHPDVIKTDKHV